MTEIKLSNEYQTKHFYSAIDLEADTEDGGEGDGHQRHGLHPPHEPAGGQPEQAVRRGAGVQVPIESEIINTYIHVEFH